MKGLFGFDLPGVPEAEPVGGRSRRKATDAIWRALAGVCTDMRGPLSQNDHARISAAVRSLRQKKATPDEIRAVAVAYHAKYPKGILTAKNLDFWFNSFRSQATMDMAKSEQRETDRERIGRLNYQAARTVLVANMGKLAESWGKYPRRTEPWPGLEKLDPMTLGDFARWLDSAAVSEAYRRLAGD